MPRAAMVPLGDLPTFEDAPMERQSFYNAFLRRRVSSWPMHLLRPPAQDISLLLATVGHHFKGWSLQWQLIRTLSRNPHGHAWALPTLAADTCTMSVNTASRGAPPAHRSERGVGTVLPLTLGGQGAVRSYLYGFVSGRIYVRQHQFCADHFHGRVPDLLVQFSTPEQEFCLSSPNGTESPAAKLLAREEKFSTRMLVHFVKSTGRFSRGKKRRVDQVWKS